MTAPIPKFSIIHARVEVPSGIGFGGFAAEQGSLDAQLFALFGGSQLKRALRSQDKLDLQEFGIRVDTVFESLIDDEEGSHVSMTPIEVHDYLIKGLPGQALFIAASMAVDSLGEALPLFDCTAKTAWKKLDGPLSRAESEQALRLGRIAAMASHVLGSQQAGKQYLKTPNFALGGTTPLDLAQTAEGERLVLNELQAQREGGPV